MVLQNGLSPISSHSMELCVDLPHLLAQKPAFQLQDLPFRLLDIARNHLAHTFHIF